MVETLRMRLVLWHTVIFGLLAFFVFTVAYYMVSHQLLRAIDVDLKDTAQEFSERLKKGGIKALKVEIDSEIASHGNNVFFTRLLDKTASISFEEINSTRSVNFPKPDLSNHNLQWFNIDTDMGVGSVRALAIPVTGFGWIEIGLSLAEYESQMNQIIFVFSPSLLIILLLGVLASWLQLGTVFRSVEQIQSTAISISKGELDRRVEFSDQGKELANLADAFNMMLDRIQLLFREMRDVSDNIAHDLRTPVSRIRGVAEIRLRAPYVTDKEKVLSQAKALAIIVEESEYLGEMINTMLEISQTDAGLIEQQKEDCDIALLLHEVHDLLLPVAEVVGISLSLNLKNKSLPVLGNKARLQRVFANLIDNALKFSTIGGQVSLSGEVSDHWVLLQISDKGIGILPDDITHVFERFYRSDKSRSKPGNGLGLSYAMSIVRSHGGNILIESTLGKGSVFTVRLPLS